MPTEDYPRKIELQSPADFTYLFANVTNLAREKLDLHLPLSATNNDGPDPMRERVRELVDEVSSLAKSSKHYQEREKNKSNNTTTLVYLPHVHNGILFNQYQRARLLVPAVPVPGGLHRARDGRIRSLRLGTSIARNGAVCPAGIAHNDSCANETRRATPRS